MTGRDLIIYILKDHLEDEPIFKDGKPIGFLTEDEVATRLGVGKASIDAMFKLEILPGVKIDETVYIFGDYESWLRGEYEKKKNT